MLSRVTWRVVVATLAVGIVLSHPLSLWAGQIFRNNAVGGISIDPTGLVGNLDPASHKMLLAELRKQIQKPAANLNIPTKLRMVSLKGLEAAIEDAVRNNLGQLPDEVRYLAGLQRIQYVFVYPEENDIVLAGPGEGWRLDQNGSVVGVTTGRPVMRLDNLATAFRYVARNANISCSIDPTEQGSQNLQRLLDDRRRRGGLPREAEMVQAFGRQQVTIEGVPGTTHFARVLIAADYKMKRLAMKLDKSPVKGLTSYLDMLRGGRSVAANVNPRWWLACNYEPIAKTKDNLAWEIRGSGVKAMTEDDFVDANGKVRGTGRKSAVPQKWADMMTAKYDELSTKDQVFGELRNLMDMSVVVALIEKQGLWAKSGCSAPMLTGMQSELALEAWNAPKSIVPQCSFLKVGRSVVVTASGGVQLEPYQIISKQSTDASVSEIRTQASKRRANAKAWWWN